MILIKCCPLFYKLRLLTPILFLCNIKIIYKTRFTLESWFTKKSKLRKCFFNFTILHQIIEMTIAIIWTLSRKSASFNIRIKTINSIRRRSIHKIILNNNTHFLHYWNNLINIKRYILIHHFFNITLNSPKHHILSLIIKIPHDNWRMMRQSCHLFSNLNLGSLNKLRRSNGINFTWKHHIMPYHHAWFICQFIKFVIQINSSSPYPQYINISFKRW